MNNQPVSHDAPFSEIDSLRAILTGEEMSPAVARLVDRFNWILSRVQFHDLEYALTHAAQENEPFSREEVLFLAVESLAEGLTYPGLEEDYLSEFESEFSGSGPEETEAFRFLDQVRRDGKINMFGAPSVLVEVYGISFERAKALFVAWTEQFGKGEGQ